MNEHNRLNEPSLNEPVPASKRTPEVRMREPAWLSGEGQVREPVLVRPNRKSDAIELPDKNV